jgi:hypothetical protein
LVGYFVHEYRHVGSGATHVDPPAHFIEGGRTVDALPVEGMVLPLVVRDLRDQVSPDAGLLPPTPRLARTRPSTGKSLNGRSPLCDGLGRPLGRRAAMDNRDA